MTMDDPYSFCVDFVSDNMIVGGCPGSIGVTIVTTYSIEYYVIAR